jgi:hypothetical protein
MLNHFVHEQAAQHLLEPMVMDLEGSWNLATGGWCT